MLPLIVVRNKDFCRRDCCLLYVMIRCWIWCGAESLCWIYHFAGASTLLELSLCWSYRFAAITLLNLSLCRAFNVPANSRAFRGHGQRQWSWVLQVHATISSVVIDDIEEVYLQNLKIKIQVLRFCDVAVWHRRSPLTSTSIPMSSPYLHQIQYCKLDSHWGITQKHLMTSFSR